MFRGSSLWFAFISGAVLLGCSGTDNTSPSTSGGNSGVGGAPGGASNTGGRTAAGGGAGTGGVPTFAGAGGTGGSLGTGGAADTGGATGSGGTPGTCSSPTIRITEVDVGATVATNETEATTTGTNLMVLALSPIASGGSRLMWHGSDGNIHVTTLNADDTINTSVSAASIAGKDSGDIYADNTGGVLLVARDAQGSGTMHCGNISNLCGATSSLPTTIPCYDMYLVRFDGSSETWATKLTVSSATEPPYLTSPTDSTWVEFIWWYAHHGRIVSDGTNYAAYFGSAVSVSQTCTDSTSALTTGVNIHQGDRMQVVGPTGTLLTGHNSFDWGCSHSGYERIVWDAAANKFAMICKNDTPTGGKSGQLAYPPNYPYVTMYAVDLAYNNVGNIILGSSAGYWLTASDIRAGQTAGANGLADVHLFHFTTGAPDVNTIIASTANANDRAPHLAKYGSNMLAAWEESTATGDFTFKATGRTLYLQVLNNATGAAISTPITVPSGTGANAVYGNRYEEFKSYSDGSVAYPSAGSAATKIKILRVMPCQ